jgi:hypothetical protein
VHCLVSRLLTVLGLVNQKAKASPKEKDDPKDFQMVEPIEFSEDINLDDARQLLRKTMKQRYCE